MAKQYRKAFETKAQMKERYEKALSQFHTTRSKESYKAMKKSQQGRQNYANAIEKLKFKKQKPTLDEIYQAEYEKQAAKAIRDKAKKQIISEYGQPTERVSAILERVRQKTAAKDVRVLTKQQRYEASPGGRLSAGIQKGFRIIKQGPSRYIYSRGQPSPVTRRRLSVARGGVVTNAGTSTGKPGRPVGTVKYRDPQTGQAIGVYEYRKLLTARLRQQRMEQLRASAINPQQKAALAYIEARNKARSMDPERRVFPDTTGFIDMSQFNKDVDDAANAFP